MSDDVKTALAAALRVTMYSRADEQDAAAILAAMPGWRLVPADAVPMDAERLLDEYDLNVVAPLEVEIAHLTLAAPVDAERLKERAMSTDRGLAVPEGPYMNEDDDWWVPVGYPVSQGAGSGSGVSRWRLPARRPAGSPLRCVARRRTPEAPAVNGLPLFAVHDLGCNCWPHVSASDLDEAPIAGAVAEYREGRAAVERAVAAALTALREKVAGLSPRSFAMEGPDEEDREWMVTKTAVFDEIDRALEGNKP